MSTRPGPLVQRTTSAESQQPYSRQVSQHRRTIPKPLNFKQAMDDFAFMFPEIERDVIETVLRANNGVVQSTIDQLLVLQESALSEQTSNEDTFHLPELPPYESSIGDIGDGEEPPPAYSAVWDEEDSKPATSILSGRLSNREKTIKKQSLLVANSFWKAPLVGKLSDDFLRIENLSVNKNSKSQDNSVSCTSATKFSSPSTEQMADEDGDVKLAIYLQNEEFLHELRRNQEFLSSLEADHRRAVMTSGEPLSPTMESVPNGGARPRVPPMHDDAAFKQKLKHMGKSTRKKFSKMAKKFSRKHPQNKNQPIRTSDSTFNLLEDEDEYVEEGLDGIQEDPEEVDEDEETNGRLEKQENSIQSRVPRKLPQPSGTSRQLPQVPGTPVSGNTEPIVFYNEDNEFSFKRE